MAIKTDSFVVEINVHFPTDYNLLWDSSRKALDTIEKFKNKYPSLSRMEEIKGLAQAVEKSMQGSRSGKRIGRSKQRGQGKTMKVFLQFKDYRVLGCAKLEN